MGLSDGNVFLQQPKAVQASWSTLHDDYDVVAPTHY